MEAERLESLERLKLIEKRLKKTEVTKNLLDEDSSENEDQKLLLSKKTPPKRATMPKKQQRSKAEQQKMEDKYAKGQEDAGCCSACS